MCVCVCFCWFRSLPEDKLIKAQVMLEPQATPEPNPSPEAPKFDIHRQPAGNSTSGPPSEPRKSRVRERRREGRSKTFDWSEFKMEQTAKPVKERADTVDLSSSFSTASSFCSPSSSSTSSLASSPVSTSSHQTSSVSGAHPPSVKDEAEKEIVRRGIPAHITNSATHMPNNVTVSMTSALNTMSPGQPSISESQEQGRMEVDHPTGVHSGSDDKENRTSDVQEEIEQRWHQVETTPLREEKQVPINTALGVSANSDRLPAHELAALLDKEVCLHSVVKSMFMVSEHFVLFLHGFFSLLPCAVGTEAEGAGPTTEAKQRFERAAGECTRQRAERQRGLCTAGTAPTPSQEELYVF